jgi:hypothetical protein
MRIEGVVDVGAPAAEAFDYLADVRNEVEWHPGAVRRVAKVSEGPIGQGTVFRGEYRQLGTLETVITDYDRPRRLRMRASGRRVDVTATIEVTGRDDRSSTLGVTGEFAPHGILRFVLPVVAPLIRAQYGRDIRSLHQALSGARQR